MNAVNVEKKHRADESPKPPAECQTLFPSFLGLQKGWQKGSNSAREQQGLQRQLHPTTTTLFSRLYEAGSDSLYPYLSLAVI